MLIPFVLQLLMACLLQVRGGDHPDGESKVSRAQDALGNYHFSYSVKNNEGEQFREEGTDVHGRVVGSYGLTHADGTHRVVDYVADAAGFRAKVRSNEPGVADSADAAVDRTDSSPLSVAATSQFGKRNREADPTLDKPYAGPTHREITRIHNEPVGIASGTPKVDLKSSDEDVKESRQRTFDDYRPLSPVAYYPSGSYDRDTPIRRPTEANRSPRILEPQDDDHKPANVYFPPIDPHKVIIRRPDEQDDVYSTNTRRPHDERDFYTTTSRRPFVPPYGGFDDDPPSEHPGVPLTAIHGGAGPRLPPPTPTSVLRGVKHHGIDQNNFGSLPRYPLGVGLPPLGRTPGMGLNMPIGRPFHRPYTGVVTPQRFVLRAVPIPNGIQAVRVDPTSGRIYERLVYPIFLRQDGVTAYDRNILLHNDDLSDDDNGYIDIPFSSDRQYREQDDENPRNRIRRHNGTYAIDGKSLNEPSADDLAWIQKQLSLVEDIQRDRVKERSVPNVLTSDEDSEFQEEFDEDRLGYGRGGRLSNSPRSGFPEDSFPRVPRRDDNLASQDSNISMLKVDLGSKSDSHVESEKSDTEVESK